MQARSDIFEGRVFKGLIHIIVLMNLLDFSLQAQDQASVTAYGLEADTTGNPSGMLLLDAGLQIDISLAVNNMYNFNFTDAEREFRFIKYDYPKHPLPDFLLGLSQWWRIMPNLDDESFDARFVMHMDSAIYKAEKLLEIDENNKEGAFFLAAAHGFKGRLYSERRSWRKATYAGSQALKYLDVGKSGTDAFFHPELMFGDALFNYYREWIPENYPLLKPILVFFPRGDKQIGLEQLREVSKNSFYSRTEAQYFLMRILYYEEKDVEGGYEMARYLHQTFPNNAYFHRFYVMLSYLRGRTTEMEMGSKEILRKLDEGYVGYEATSGRYAAFFLGQVSDRRGDKEAAKAYYQRAINFGEETEAQESGYYLYAMLNLAKLYMEEDRNKEANKLLNSIKKYAKRKHPAHQEARDFLKGRK
jgi:tetratricopeptide (TPR) repeat protein